MQKLLFLLILLFNVGYSYVTSTVGSLQDKNILVYNDKFKINTYSQNNKTTNLPFLSSSIHNIGDIPKILSMQYYNTNFSFRDWPKREIKFAFERKKGLSC